MSELMLAMTFWDRRVNSARSNTRRKRPNG
jgi:hypothetical protein